MAFHLKSCATAKGPATCISPIACVSTDSVGGPLWIGAGYKRWRLKATQIAAVIEDEGHRTLYC
jgi:hypothetical protein